MKERQELARQIDELRNYLEKLIGEESEMWDPEIVAASKMLDAALNEYDNLLKKGK